jgi:hypothetical protein
VEIGIPYGQGKKGRTGWEVLGHKGVLGLAMALLGLVSGYKSGLAGVEGRVNNLIASANTGLARFIGWREVDEENQMDVHALRGQSPLSSSTFIRGRVS